MPCIMNRINYVR